MVAAQHLPRGTAIQEEDCGGVSLGGQSSSAQILVVEFDVAKRGSTSFTIVSMSLQLLKKGDAPLFTPGTVEDVEDDDGFSKIRCPLCQWQPTPSSAWMCFSGEGTPEPFFGGCGTIWNTFATRGRCPGCAHQWLWTSCLRCHGWSLHEDWYASD